MDFFDAMVQMTAAGQGGGDATLPWTTRLKAIRLFGLPPAIAEAYLDLLLPVYERLGQGDPILDTIVNMAAQQLAYRAVPWSPPIHGAAPPVGVDLLIAAEAGPSLFATSFGFPRASSWSILAAATQATHWIASDPVLANRGAGVKLLVGAPEQALASLSADAERTISLVHICDVSSVSHSLSNWALVSGRMMPGGVVVFSGERHLIRALAANPDFPQQLRDHRYIDTVKISADEPDRLGGLLAARPATNGSEGRAASLGAPYTDAYRCLTDRSDVMSMDEAPVVNDLADLREQAVWSGENPGVPMAEANCFAIDGYGGGGRHDFADLSDRDDLGLSPKRWSRPLGRIACLPGGYIVDQLPVCEGGKTPIEAVMPYHVATLCAHSPEHGRVIMPHRPVVDFVDLKGPWMRLPAPGGSLSHWVIENFLPLLVMAEADLKPNLLNPTALAAYQAEYLRLAGFDPVGVRVSDPAIIYRCEHLYLPLREPVPNPFFGFARVHHPSAREAIFKLLDRAGIERRGRVEKIYVSRLDAVGYRVCINEAAVIEAVSRRGYRVVNGSSLTPMQALDLYGNAAVIVGPLGAGLCNAVFSPSGCQIVSFQARSYFEEHIEQIAHLIGHDYAYLGCEHFESEDWVEGGARNGNFVVDIGALLRLLEEAEARVHKRP